MSRLLEMVLVSTGGMTAGGLIWRLLLVALSILATVHLLSLWGTRYGDHNTTSKSLFLSLILHACFGLGWVTVADRFSSRPPQRPVEAPRMPITLVDADDSAPLAGTSKVPIFNSGLTTSDSPLLQRAQGASRRSQEATLEELSSPEIQEGPDLASQVELPEFASETQEAVPDLEQSTVTVPAPATSEAMVIEETAAPLRPEIVATPAARRTITRSSEASESVARPSFQRGVSATATPFSEDGISTLLPSDYDMQVTPMPQEAPGTRTVQGNRNAGPASLVEDDSPAPPEISVQGKSSFRRPARTVSSPGRKAKNPDDIGLPPATGDVPQSVSRTADDRLLNDSSTLGTNDGSPEPNFIKPSLPTMRSPARAVETYQARTSSQRMATALKHGGSEESERAVEESLKWLASVQEPNGHWSAARHGGGASKVDPQGQDRQGGGKFADSGITGLVVLSFLGAGYTHDKGPYTAEVRRALEWLISQQSTNGYLGGKATRYDQNYCHAIATFALAEAYAMQSDASEFPELRSAVRKAIKLISAFQNDDGGWRYGRGGENSESDMSMFGWQLMALKSAVNGGIAVPEETRRGMLKFLEVRGRGVHGGLAGYRVADKPTPAMTAEALFCRQMFATRAGDAASEEATEYLRKNLPRLTTYDEYYWYYGTLAMHHVDDQPWREWNRALRDMLISLQRRDGPLAGSWDPKGKWGGIGGRIYSTALSTMCLEVYYRYTSVAKPNGSAQ